jgi:hypothetical protein
MLVAQALLLITDHSAVLFFVSLKLASLQVRFVDENAQLLHLFIATAVSFIPLSFRLYTPTPTPRSCLVLVVLSNSQVCSCSFAESLSTFPS